MKRGEPRQIPLEALAASAAAMGLTLALPRTAQAADCNTGAQIITKVDTVSAVSIHDGKTKQKVGDVSLKKGELKTTVNGTPTTSQEIWGAWRGSVDSNVVIDDGIVNKNPQLTPYKGQRGFEMYVVAENAPHTGDDMPPFVAPCNVGVRNFFITREMMQQPAPPVPTSAPAVPTRVPAVASPGPIRIDENNHVDGRLDLGHGGKVGVEHSGKAGIEHSGGVGVNFELGPETRKVIADFGAAIDRAAQLPATIALTHEHSLTRETEGVLAGTILGAALILGISRVLAGRGGHNHGGHGHPAPAGDAYAPVDHEHLHGHGPEGMYTVGDGPRGPVAPDAPAAPAAPRVYTRYPHRGGRRNPFNWFRGRRVVEAAPVVAPAAPAAEPAPTVVAPAAPAVEPAPVVVAPAAPAPATPARRRAPRRTIAQAEREAYERAIEAQARGAAAAGRPADPA